MTRSLVVTAILVLLLAPVHAEQASPADRPSVADRIEQGLTDAARPPPGAAAPELLSPAPLSAGLGEIGTPDASLADPITPSRLLTPLDSADIEQRIDKGLTAAGEKSAFPPDYAYGAFQRGWFLTAFALALDRAKAGDPTAQTLLGELLSRGLGVKQDLVAASDWYRLAAENGDPEALYALGRIRLEGRGAGQDFAKAADFFEQAAKKGHTVAARELAYLLLQGKGRERNAMLAAAFMRRAAAGGDIDAQYALAGLYVEGVGVVADEAQAARWFGEAARAGHIGAQIEYAILLFNGRGIEKNEALAAAWFREAAQADNPVAQVRLARLLAEGRGEEKNPQEAARWYLIAKRRGIQDDFLEGWFTALDEPTRQAATHEAERWGRSRGEWMQAAAPATEDAMDKELE
jgi:uncharacterized protein